MRLAFLALLPAMLSFADQASFVPTSFSVPQAYETKQFKLVPLSPEVAKQDYDAYMSSIEWLQQTFSGSTRWPNKNITMADAVKDTEGEQSRFQARKSFTYSVLSLDGQKELGCVYITPSKKQGYDAAIRVWVTKGEHDNGLEPVLIAEVKSWLAAKWPFQSIAWPKRDISAEQWNALPEKTSPVK